LFKILIVDDDKIIRQGLKAIIENNTSEYKIVGEASNGKQALAAIKQLYPDILIADIKMPVMDGVQLIKYINNDDDLKLKIIVLSGFDEYEFVRETLKSGAEDYLLKPVENEELLKLLRKVAKDIQSDKKKEKQARALKKKVANSMEVVREKILNQLIQEQTETVDLSNKLNEFDVSRFGKFVIAITSVDYFNSKDKGINLRENVQELIKRYARNLKVFVTESELGVVVLFTGNDSLIQSVTTAFEKSRESIANKKSYTVSTGISNIFDDIYKTCRAYDQACAALERRFYEGEDRVILYKESECCYNTIDENEFKNIHNKLLNWIEVGNVPESKRCIEEIMDRLDKNNISPTQYRKTLVNILNKLYVNVGDFKEASEKYADEVYDIVDFIKKTSTLYQLREYVVRGFFRIIEKMNMLRIRRSKKIVEKAKIYINKHYNKKINLRKTAEHVCLNHSYFSELFKKQTGKRFIDYVTGIRINKAKEFLHRPDLKVYEVGQMVGYDEPISFNRAFKRIVGVSPSQYRKIVK